MSHTIVNPPALHDPKAFGYSHSVLVPAGSDLVILAGQYASGPQGQVVSSNFGEQVQQAFDNVAAALAAHGLDRSHVVQLRTYVVGLDFERLGAIGAVVGSIWGATPPTQTVIGVTNLALPEILFEVEVMAARP